MAACRDWFLNLYANAAECRRQLRRLACAPRSQNQCDHSFSSLQNQDGSGPANPSSRANRQSGSDRGIAPENSKVTSLDFAWADVYCGLTAQDLRVRAHKRLVNEFPLERNYERKILVRIILRQTFLDRHMANRAEKRFGLTNDRVTVLGIEFRYVVAGI